MTRGPREDERPVLVGRFVYYEPLLPAAVLARQARRLRMRAQLAERLGDVDAHPIYRAAIERFVDAFLVDRRGQVDCFTEAHRLGRYLEERFGCPMQLSDDGDHWTVECGVPALHSRFGSSYRGANLGRCSLCGADDFQCDHVPGRFYDGRHCYREVYEVNLDEVSVVQFPEDPRTYRLQIATPMSAMLEARGPTAPAGRGAHVHPLHRVPRRRPRPYRGGHLPEPLAAAGHRRELSRRRLAISIDTHAVGVPAAEVQMRRRVDEVDLAKVGAWSRTSPRTCTC